MAKRKRLTPAKAEYLTAPSGLEIKAFGPQSGKVPGPPIAQVSGDAAAAAALSEVSAVLQLAREEGRMIQSLPLSAIEGAHLVRDRLAGEPGAMGAADEDWQALKDSLQSRGQQVPIEVLELGAGRYGLISGWRRLTALRQLAAEQGAEQGGEQRTRAPEVLALIRRPETSAEAYVAMVEENEIRLGLSFFERARIVVQAVDQRVYDSEKQAL
ncbi:ParB N-terminal domain-containing protein, partial [Shimia sp.]|uniref:ParB N-terminal domain-containing protein n=1 Tax=Shimia sp. TaxID=1954381 RepID=UPI003561EE32